MLAAGVAAMEDCERSEVLGKVRGFSAFTDDNDPHQEHDFGSISHDGTAYFWKIDYYNADLTHASSDSTNPNVTKRVLTIMRADEY